MKVLITSYTTPQASHRFCFFHKIVGDFTYFVASDVCENFPYDFNVAALKNKCIKAARITQPDWLVLLSGIDAGLSKLPNFKKLDENILYLGKKFAALKFQKKHPTGYYQKKYTTIISLMNLTNVMAGKIMTLHLILAKI